MEYIPPAIPPLFVEQYYEANAAPIVEVPEEREPIFRDGPPPPPPPPQAKPSAPAFQKSKLTSFYKPSGKPPAKPPAGVSKPAAAAPPPGPPAEPLVKLRVPKARAPKQLTALIQSHLVPSAHVGSLTYNLVTVIPNIECTIEDSWKGIQDAYTLVVSQVRSLAGLYGAFICIETHGDTHKSPESKGKPKKARGKNVGDPSAAPDQVELDFFETNDGTFVGDDPVVYMKASRTNKLTGKAHMHVLCWYSDHHFPRLDFSALKRVLIDLFPTGDVHEVHLRENVRNKTPHYVRTTAYIFKSLECPATAENWKKYVNAETSPPLPEFVHGAPFLADPPTESVTRWLLFLQKIAKWCRYSLDTARGSANAFYTEQHQMTQEEKDMRTFAAMLRSAGIFVYPARERGTERYYELEKRLEYKVLRSIGPGRDAAWMQARLTELVPQAIGFMLKYHERLSLWTRMSGVFDHIPKQSYTCVELKDGYYNFQKHRFYSKNDPIYEFVTPCFRSYPYTIEEVKTTEPKEWLKLLEYACTEVEVPRLVSPSNPFDAAAPLTQQLDKVRLLRDFASLLRRRKPKQPVPFLYGVSNSGKTTLSSFIRTLLPIECITAINNSSAPFSGIHEDTMLVYNEEFKVETVSREDLLVLLDGSQPLTVRKLHQDARLIANPLMPILLQDNYYPTYYHDDSRALENRLSIHYFPRRIQNVKLDSGTLIANEHLFVARYLNDWLAANPSPSS